jgi:hypothetical protein
MTERGIDYLPEADVIDGVGQELRTVREEIKTIPALCALFAFMNNSRGFVPEIPRSLFVGPGAEVPGSRYHDGRFFRGVMVFLNR